VAIALANRLSHIAWVVLDAHSDACERALRARAHETPLTATQQAIQRDFALLKTRRMDDPRPTTTRNPGNRR
jgi:hypothetical protein